MAIVIRMRIVVSQKRAASADPRLKTAIQEIEPIGIQIGGGIRFSKEQLAFLKLDRPMQRVEIDGCDGIAIRLSNGSSPEPEFFLNLFGTAGILTT